jgi:hypothetical protein
VETTLDTLIARRDPSVMLGPGWADERWPVASNARALPVIDEHGQLLGINSWWVSYGEDWEIPAGFEYVSRDPADVTLWIHVVEGVAECLAIKHTADRPITASALRRLSIPGLVEEGVLMAARSWDEIPKRRILWPSFEEAKRAHTETATAHRRAARLPGERAHITPELLKEVATIYRANLASGAPTKAVADALYYSRASAGRLVMKAREGGFLPPTEQRKARG